MVKELSEDLNRIRKIQSEMKDTATVVKDNLQGNNSRVDEDENQINDMEHKEAQNNRVEQGCQTHFHRRPHQPRSCLQRAESNFRAV